MKGSRAIVRVVVSATPTMVISDTRRAAPNPATHAWAPDWNPLKKWANGSRKEGVRQRRLLSPRWLADAVVGDVLGAAWVVGGLVGMGRVVGDRGMVLGGW